MGLKRLKKGYFGVWLRKLFQGLPLAQAEMTNTEARAPPSDTQFTDPPKNARIVNLQLESIACILPLQSRSPLPLPGA